MTPNERATSCTFCRVGTLCGTDQLCWITQYPKYQVLCAEGEQHCGPTAKQGTLNHVRVLCCTAGKPRRPLFCLVTLNMTRYIIPLRDHCHSCSSPAKSSKSHIIYFCSMCVQNCVLVTCVRCLVLDFTSEVTLLPLKPSPLVLVCGSI